jgi:hypothetical protein
MKIIRIVLLVLIVIGIGLLVTQSLWAAPFANWIINQGGPAVSQQLPISTSTSSVQHVRPVPPAPKPTPSSHAVGTLEGNMTIGPVCPVEQAGHPCNPTPAMYAAHLVYVYTSDRTRIIATLVPDANGHFSVTLPVGNYVADVQHQPVGSAQGVPATFTITEGKIVSLTLTIDTGIR